MSSKVKLLLIATASGKDLAKQITSSGSYGDLLQGSDGVTLPLICVNGMPILNYWMRSVQRCSRLLPLAQKVFIICNENNYMDIIEWSQNPDLSLGGFPAENILNAGPITDPHEALCQFLASNKRYLASGNDAMLAPDDHLVVARADSLFEMDFNLQKLIEHFIVRSKDTIAYWEAPNGFPFTPSSSVPLIPDESKTAATSSNIFNTDPNPNGPLKPDLDQLSRMAGSPSILTSSSSPALPRNSNRAVEGVLFSAPLMLLRSSSLAIIGSSSPISSSAAAAATPPSPSLGQVMQQIVAAGKPVLGSRVRFFFSLSDLTTLALASNFYSYLVKKGEYPAGPATQALQDVLYNKPTAMRRTLYMDQKRAVGAKVANAIWSPEEIAQLSLPNAAAAAAAAANPVPMKVDDAVKRGQVKAFVPGFLTEESEVPLAGKSINNAIGTGKALGLALGNGSDEDLTKVWREFWVMHQQGARFERLSGVIASARDLPYRFTDPKLWKHEPRNQHLVYTTSNNDYGRKAVSALEMPTTFRGSSGAFSKSFPSMVRDSGLITAYSTSKVHRALDDF